jgi:hypothetical protein
MKALLLAMTWPVVLVLGESPDGLAAGARADRPMLLAAADSGQTAPIQARSPTVRGRGGIAHCRGAERVVYSCDFGKKLASICEGQGLITYRYGPAGTPEIEIASDGADGRVHEGGVIGQGDGWQDHLRFSSGGFDYVVFDGKFGRLSDSPGTHRSGVSVWRGKAELARHECPAGRDRHAVYPPFQYQTNVPEETDKDYQAWY